MSAGGIVLDDDALSGILTHEGRPRAAECGSSISGEMFYSVEPTVRGKLCLLAASKALKDDSGSVEQFHDRLQLRRTGMSSTCMSSPRPRT